MNKGSLLLLSAALLGGCVTRTETVQPPRFESPSPLPAQAQPQPIQKDKRVLMDPALQGSLSVLKIKDDVGTSGFLRLQIDVKNLTSAPLKFIYRIDWFEKDGNPLPMAASTPLDWMLLKGETSFLAAAAPTPAARDFRISFLAAPNNR